MNFLKARKHLSQISYLITREGADPAIDGRIYVVIVLAVLSYGLETWVWTSSMLNTIRVHHHRSCRRLAGNRPWRQQNDTYWYCPDDEAMRICKQRSIQVYVSLRRHTIMTKVVKRPTYKLCSKVMRSIGTSTRTKFLWKQDLSHWIELVKDNCQEGQLIHDADD